MSTYTLTTTNINLEGLEIGRDKIVNAARELAPAARTALMLVGGPLIGLAFVIALPVICLALAAYYGAKLIAAHWAEIKRRIKNVMLFLAAPFIGLAYLVALPFIGLGTLAYFGVKALHR